MVDPYARSKLRKIDSGTAMAGVSFVSAQFGYLVWGISVQ